MIKAEDAKTKNFYAQDCAMLEKELTDAILETFRYDSRRAIVAGAWSVFAINSMINTLKEAGYKVDVDPGKCTFTEELADGRFVAMQWVKFLIEW